jgi:hypothetical protein
VSSSRNSWLYNMRSRNEQMGLLEWYFGYLMHFTAYLMDLRNMINSHYHNISYAIVLMTPMQQENQPHTVILPNLSLCMQFMAREVNPLHLKWSKTL